MAERKSSLTDLRHRIAELSAELVAKEAVIVDLKKVADERLRVIETLNAEITHERYLLGRQLEEKEQMIASLATAAEERLQFIHELNARGRGR